MTQHITFVETLHNRHSFTYDAAHILWDAYRAQDEPVPTAEEASKLWVEWDARDFIKQYEVYGNVNRWLRRRVQQFAIFADRDGNTRYLLHFHDPMHPAPPVLFSRP